MRVLCRFPYNSRMKPLFCRLAVMGALLAASIGRAGAQSATLHGELLKDWVDLKEMMMKIADAMPEEKYGFKSTPPQRDFGQQVLHVAGANAMYLRFLGGKTQAPAINREAKGKGEILKALADS